MKSFVVSFGRFRVDGLRASPKPSVCSSSGARSLLRNGSPLASKRSLKRCASDRVAVLKLTPVTVVCRVSDPVTAVADSLQALRNGTTDAQWEGLKANPLVRDLISRCADLEAAWLLGDPESVGTSRGRQEKGLRSSVDARLLLAA